MDLITAEIKALNKRCEQLESNKELLNNEINLLNKLLFYEQKHIRQLNQLLTLYENNLMSNNKYYFINQINANKVVVKNSECELTLLRKQLTDWRKEKKSLHDQKTDHTYSKSHQNKEALRTIPEKANSKQTKNATNSVNFESTLTDPRCIVNCNNLRISQPISLKTGNEPQEKLTPAVQLEIIPKSEPLSDAETDSSETEDIETNVNNGETNNNESFLLMSEHLSHTKAFSDYLAKNADNTIDGVVGVCNKSTIDKFVAIDLDKYSDKDSTQDNDNDTQFSIFGNEIIDLTPKTSAEKSNLKTTAKTKQLTKNKKTVIKSEQSYKVETNEAEVETNKTTKISFSGNLYRCKWNKCSYKSEMKCNAIRHYRTHTAQGIYKCSVCTRRFTSTRNLKAHTNAHNAGQKFVLKSKIISGLSKKVKAKDENKKLMYRNKYKERGAGNLLCPIAKCDRKYHKLNHLVRHIDKIHGQKMVEAFKRQHYKRKVNISRTKVYNSKSDTIKKSTVQKNEKKMIEDLKSETNKYSLVDEKEKQWKCDYNNCERSYFEKHNLKRHQLEVHKKLSKTVFKGSNFRTNFDFQFFDPPKVCNNANNSIVNNENNRKFVCDYDGCNSIYFTHSGLYKHKMNKHKLIKTKTPVKPMNSNSDKMPNSEGLKVPNNRIDNESSLIPEWICKIANCGSRYIYKHNLKRHMKKHHNIWDDRLSNDSNFSSNALKEKYSCTYEPCSFLTSSNKTLARHYKTHFESDNKPFKCLIIDCDYSVDTLFKLKNHVLNRHSEQEFFRAQEATGVHYPVWY